MCFTDEFVWGLAQIETHPDKPHSLAFPKHHQGNPACHLFVLSILTCGGAAPPRAIQPWNPRGWDPQYKVLKDQQSTLLGAKGIATRSKGLTTRNKKLVETISYRL